MTQGSSVQIMIWRPRVHAPVGDTWLVLGVCGFFISMDEVSSTDTTEELIEIPAGDTWWTPEITGTGLERMISLHTWPKYQHHNSRQSEEIVHLFGWSEDNWQELYSLLAVNMN